MESEFSKLQITPSGEDMPQDLSTRKSHEEPKQGEAAPLQNNGFLLPNEIKVENSAPVGSHPVMWNGEIEEIERPPSVMDHSPHMGHVDPLHALTVIRAMMVQFASGQELHHMHGFFPHGMANPYRVGATRNWLPFGPHPEHVTRLRRNCPVHSLYMQDYEGTKQARFTLPSFGEDASDDIVPITPAELAQMNPRKLQVMHKHLLTLLHAYSCLHRETTPGGQHFRNCDMPYCKTTKKLVRHMKNCKNVTECTFPLCVKSWRLIAHYGKCGKGNCPICKPFMKNRHSRRNRKDM